MKLSSLWTALRGKSATPGTDRVSLPEPELLTQARALASAGRTLEASQLYRKLKSKQHTALSLVEHAELQLELGDYFAASSEAYRALQLEPNNARALAIQHEVTRREDAEERQRK
jgi:Flp pilus assembly protein TadD